MKAFYFYSTVVGFFAGIVSGEKLHVSIWTYIFVFVVATLVATFLFAHAKKKEKALAHELLIVLLFFFAFAIGAVRMTVAENNLQNNPLADFVGKDITFAGEVEDNIGSNVKNTVVKIFAYSDNGVSKKVTPTAILLNSGGALNYRDIVVFEGKLELPKNFKTKSGGEFDYVTYLKKSDIGYIVSYPKIIHREHDDTFSITEVLYGIKNWFVANIESLLPEPDASLATGVTIAGKGVLPKDVQDDFVKAGIIHIVVLSGYNVAIVVRGVMYVFGFLGKRKSALIGAVGIVLFVILTGGQAPVVRSAIMAGVMLLGMLSYKNILPNRALFGAAFLMVLWNPYILLHDASFALSFLATFAVINIVDILKPYLSFVTERFQMRNILSETLATQIFVLPYLLFELGRLSIIAPLSNIIVLPLIPPIMFLGFIVGVVAFIPFVGLPFAGGLLILTSFVIWTAHFLGSLPFASFNINISLLAMILLYVFYFALGLYLSNKQKSVLILKV